METEAKKFRDIFRAGLKTYLSDKNEASLTDAYELGRQALKDGFSELAIIEMYHVVLKDILRDRNGGNDCEILERSSVYLVECLAPFEVKLRSYQDLIEDLNKKNEQLKEEIQNRKEVDKELQRSKDHFQSLIEHAQDVITVLDGKGIIRYTSPSIRRILGYGKSELLGRDTFQYLHPRDLDRVKNIFDELLAEPDRIRSEEFRFKHRDGYWVFLESIAKHVSDEDGTRIIVNSRDVTERKRAIKQLRENEAQLSEAQRIAKVGSWEWRPGEEDGLSWSDEMCRIYGIDPTSFNHTYETFLEHVHPEDRDRIEREVTRALELKQPFAFEHRIIRGSDGEERKLLGRGQVITDGKGQVVRLIGTGQDITEQKEREQKLREYSNRLRRLSARIERAREEERTRIAREVHDELGQMLTVLKMDISMLSGELKKKIDPEIMDFLERETQNILKRINTIISSVQRITAELRPEVLDDLGLKDAIEWQAQEFAERSGLRVNFNSNISNPNMLDEEQSTIIFRIFQETLTNIIRHAQASKVDIRLDIEDECLVLVVRDNGIGITEEQREASASLGLIGMRERTQLLGGTVRIEGKENEQTKVMLQIPLDKRD
ncbi:PAS domain-containing protein [Aliifodinibius sp. S!AR15-10]|uniref:PAS domain-containing protein n=1 Tax=Aliifodinibius sp. S!AR15-10 TaxID=2950437 RepID=UPI00285BAC21|nr:PAS domain-containing protein [Aliifodinibius sp. S!AR15-10]MDR8393752.1 PAS domain-containing protein [Aliifodinibius sp. S!AR15-10]